MGPGKADLLQGIAETGSIAAAGRRMGMSYKRAWALAEVLNRMFAEPLVVTQRGGHDRGGAALTATGETVLALFRRMQATAEEATRADADRIQALAAPRLSGARPPDISERK